MRLNLLVPELQHVQPAHGSGQLHNHFTELLLHCACQDGMLRSCARSLYTQLVDALLLLLLLLLGSDPHKADGLQCMLCCDAALICQSDLPPRQLHRRLPRLQTMQQEVTCGCMCLQIGLVSAWLEDNMHRGRVIGFRGFEGVFTPSDCCPEGLPEAGVLLIAGGIGITPLKAMLADCLAAKVPTTLLYSVRAPAEAAFLQEFAEVSHMLSMVVDSE